MNATLLLARVTGSLVAVVLLALLAARFARRTTHGRDGEDLRVCERAGLTRDTAAVVLECGGRRLLVGVGPAQISLLADLGPCLPAPPEVPTATVPVLPAGTEPPPAPTASTAAPTSTASRRVTVPVPRRGGQADVLITQVPLSRKAIRQLDQRRRRLAMPPTRHGTGSMLDPRTWRQGLEALRDLTARRG
jgi:flagellar biogenesis protein FliO